MTILLTNLEMVNADAGTIGFNLDDCKLASSNKANANGVATCTRNTKEGPSKNENHIYNILEQRYYEQQYSYC